MISSCFVKWQAYVPSLYPPKKVSTVIHTLFQFYLENKNDGETLGYFNRRIGNDKIIDYFKTNPATAEPMKTTSDISCLLLQYVNENPSDCVCGGIG